MRRRLAVALVLQVVLLLVAVGPRLLPHLRGDEYRIPVDPVDPIDPFRGAYVDLSYGQSFFVSTTTEGRRYVSLVRRGELYRAGGISRTQPKRRPFLRCELDDGQLRCGIESFFASQREAARLERDLAAGGAVARLKIDDAGRAAIVGLEPR